VRDENAGLHFIEWAPDGPRDARALKLQNSFPAIGARATAADTSQRRYANNCPRNEMTIIARRTDEANAVSWN